jgi:hypothetical protein
MQYLVVHFFFQRLNKFSMAAANPKNKLIVPSVSMDRLNAVRLAFLFARITVLIAQDISSITTIRMTATARPVTKSSTREKRRCEGARFGTSRNRNVTYHSTGIRIPKRMNPFDHFSVLSMFLVSMHNDPNESFTHLSANTFHLLVSFRFSIF